MKEVTQDLIDAARLIARFAESENLQRLSILGVVWTNRSPTDLHCPTCQCPNLHPTMPIDATGKPRSRSWHHDQLLPQNDVNTGATHAGLDADAGATEGVWGTFGGRDFD